MPKVHATLGSFLLDGTAGLVEFSRLSVRDILVCFRDLLHLRSRIGGLLIEGTSDPPGRIWCTNVLRRRGDFVTLEAVVFSTNFQAGFEPEMFQPHLTKNFIHKMETQGRHSGCASFSFLGEKIAQFFEMWKLAFKETLAIADFGIRQHFVACGLYLAQQYRINTQSKYLRKGFLIWYQ